MQAYDSHRRLFAEVSSALVRDGLSSMACQCVSDNVTAIRPVATSYTQYYLSIYTAIHLANGGERKVINTPSFGLVTTYAIGVVLAMIEVLDRPNDEAPLRHQSAFFCT
jgi:hypothetical protein